MSSSDNVLRMAAPNHMTGFALADSLAIDAACSGRQYPLMGLLLPESEGSGLAERLVFTAAPYRCGHWAERDCHAPPTWMDPEIFVRQVKRACPELIAQAAKLAEAGELRKAKKLVEPLVAAFETYYLPYVRQQFTIAVPLLAQWLVCHAAEE